MTAPKLVRAARARSAADDPAASRELLLEALQLAAQLAADRELPATARSKAAAELRLLSERLDTIDAAARAAAPERAVAWGAVKLEAI